MAVLLFFLSLNRRYHKLASTKQGTKLVVLLGSGGQMFLCRSKYTAQIKWGLNPWYSQPFEHCRVPSLLHARSNHKFIPCIACFQEKLENVSVLVDSLLYYI